MFKTQFAKLRNGEDVKSKDNDKWLKAKTDKWLKAKTMINDSILYIILKLSSTELSIDFKYQ